MSFGRLFQTPHGAKNRRNLDMFFSEQNQVAHLFVNQGSGAFTDQATTAGLAMVLGEFSKSMFWDFDNDAHFDLYIVQAGDNRHMVS